VVGLLETAKGEKSMFLPLGLVCLVLAILMFIYAKYLKWREARRDKCERNTIDVRGYSIE
jgi:hypothetical protein